MIVLEPARIVSEREMRSHEVIKNLVLDENEWSRFQEIMDSDEEPTDNLRGLMKGSE